MSVEKKKEAMRNFGHKRLKGGCVGLCQGADEVWSVFVPTGMLAGGIRLPKHEDPAGVYCVSDFMPAADLFCGGFIFTVVFCGFCRSFSKPLLPAV